KVADEAGDIFAGPAQRGPHHPENVQGGKKGGAEMARGGPLRPGAGGGRPPAARPPGGPRGAPGAAPPPPPSAGRPGVGAGGGWVGGGRGWRRPHRGTGFPGGPARSGPPSG